VFAASYAKPGQESDAAGCPAAIAGTWNVATPAQRLASSCRRVVLCATATALRWLPCVESVAVFRSLDYVFDRRVVHGAQETQTQVHLDVGLLRAACHSYVVVAVGLDGKAVLVDGVFECFFLRGCESRQVVGTVEILVVGVGLAVVLECEVDQVARVLIAIEVLLEEGGELIETVSARIRCGGGVSVVGELGDRLIIGWTLLGVSPVVCECVLVIEDLLIAVRAGDFPAFIGETEPRVRPIRVLDVEVGIEGACLLASCGACCCGGILGVCLLVGGV